MVPKIPLEVIRHRPRRARLGDQRLVGRHPTSLREDDEEEERRDEDDQVDDHGEFHALGALLDRRAIVAEALAVARARRETAAPLALSRRRVLVAPTQAARGPGARTAPGVARPARGPQQQAFLEQERLVDVLDGLGLLGDGDRQAAQSDRLAVERLAKRADDRAVDLVEPELVDLEQRQRIACRLDVGDRRAHLGMKSRTRLEQTVRDHGVPRARPAISAGVPVGAERNSEDHAARSGSRRRSAGS